MLATQMMAVHEAFIDYMNRAMGNKTVLQAREDDLRFAEKFASLYARQIELLDKRRGIASMPITNVNVRSGGQAVVGHIEVHRPEASADPQPPPDGSTPRSAEPDAGDSEERHSKDPDSKAKRA